MISPTNPPFQMLHMAACIIATRNKQQTQCKLHYIAVAVILRSFILGQSCNKCHLKFPREADCLLGNPEYQGNKAEIVIGLVSKSCCYFWWIFHDFRAPTTFNHFGGTFMISFPPSFHRWLKCILAHYESGRTFAQGSLALFKSKTRECGGLLKGLHTLFFVLLNPVEMAPCYGYWQSGWLPADVNWPSSSSVWACVRPQPSLRCLLIRLSHLEMICSATASQSLARHHWEVPGLCGSSCLLFSHLFPFRFYF